MRDIKHNRKRNLLKLLDVISNDMTIGEVKTALKLDVDAYDKIIADNEAKLVDEFKDIYLALYSEDGWGKQLEVIHIIEIEPDCWNTDYEREYKIKGTRLSFNRLNVYMRDINGDGGRVGDTMSGDRLKKYTKINEVDYNDYVMTYHLMKDRFDNIVTKP